MDVFTKEKRSEVMARVGQKDTGPEIVVRKLLHSLGYRFRIHRMDLPGRPDIILPRYMTAIFVHGCFWHGHNGCRRAKRPSSNVDFWNEKLDGNIVRDRRNVRMLRKLGWRVIILWECQIESQEGVARRLARLLEQ